MSPQQKQTEAEQESSLFAVAGFRHVETGAVINARFAIAIAARGSEYEPLYCVGPDVVAPLLAALIGLVDAKPEQAAAAFYEHREAAARALGEFCEMGGQLP